MKTNLQIVEERKTYLTYLNSVEPLHNVTSQWPSHYYRDKAMGHGVREKPIRSEIGVAVQVGHIPYAKDPMSLAQFKASIKQLGLQPFNWQTYKGKRGKSFVVEDLDKAWNHALDHLTQGPHEKR